MNKGRLEAFSDGVVAILITIMVLELRVPRGADLEALRPLLPVFLTYILSFVTGWMGENHFTSLPTAVYGAVMLLAAVAYTILQRMIVTHQGPRSRLAAAVGSDT